MSSDSNGSRAPRFGKSVGSVIGAAPKERAPDTPVVPEPLAPCPCGDDAVWYRPDREQRRRTGAGPDDARGPALGRMDVNDFSLCEGCFRSAVPEAEWGLWRKVTREEADAAARARFGRPLAPKRGGPESQERSGADPFAPPPLPDDW